MTLDNGSRFGLPPIGTTNMQKDAPKNDSKRSAFPALATRGSVFAWTPNLPLLHNASVSAGFTATINLRNNTAAGGVSVDVPSWAAGAIVVWSTLVAVMGAGITYHSFFAFAPPTFGLTTLFERTHPAISLNQADQFVVPFFDEPSFTIQEVNSASNTNGSVGSTLSLVGFVRNV